MGNTTVVSFKVGPRHYVVLKALAAVRRMSMSEFVREAVTEALELDAQADRFRSLFDDDEREALARVE